MKRLEIKYLYKILILLIVNILLPNILIRVLSFIFVLFFIDDNKLLIIMLSIIIITITTIKVDYIKIGFVDYVYDKYTVINKIIYKTKIYNTDFHVGDIVYTKGYTINENEVDLKKNIIFIEDECNKIGTNLIKKSIYDYINNSNLKDIYNSIYYGIYNEDVSNEFENVSLSLSAYYLIYLFFRKNKKVGLILLLIQSIIFGFQIKYILIIIELILSLFDFDKVEHLLIKILVILCINKHLLLNYSFVLCIIFSILNITKFGINSILVSTVQSLLFGEVKIFNILFYKFYVFEKITIYILSIFSLIVFPFKNIFICFLHIVDSLSSILSFSLRGRITLFNLLFISIIIKLFNIKNDYIKYLICLISFLIPFNTLITHINFIDVGQGDSILIVDSSSQESILIDTGSKYNYSKLRNELYSEGLYKIDYLIITHDDSDHNGNVDRLNKDFRINNIIEEGEDIYTKKLFLKYLDLPSSDNDNDNSLVYLLSIDNYSVLLTGDISSNVENDIIFNHSINDVDVLKVSHHGSKSATSKYFVGSIKPEIAVISTSGQYNHPHKNVIDTLDSFKVKTYITKNDGSIKIFFTKLIDFIHTDTNRFDIIKK